MRGTQSAITTLRIVQRIIPAHAGNTRILNRLRRVCRGSSPRMRGTPDVLKSWIGPVGIIPAHAGNTRAATPPPAVREDHPRACGEHQPVYPALLVTVGSSPRMRGTHDPITALCVLRGIIPAHAGNTESTLTVRKKYRDHPRACGEHRFPCEILRILGWIIPAHAGNTRKALKVVDVCGDHPRACGEHK